MAIYKIFQGTVQRAESIVLLALRVLLAFTFWAPGLTKLTNLKSTAAWFAEAGIPMPMINAVLAGGTEAIGAVLLLIGLGTRVISMPLVFVMIVAMFTAHDITRWSAVVDSGKSGIEMTVYFSLMLLVLIVRGAGSLSVDRFTLEKKD